MTLLSLAALAVPATAGASGTGPAFQRAVEIGLPANSSAAPAELLAVSCVSRGPCTAAGNYVDRHGYGDAMVVTEAHGNWGRATELTMPPGAVTRPTGVARPTAVATGISCPAAGYCVAVGYYVHSSNGALTGFVATQAAGKWRRALAVTLPANAAAPANAQLPGVACTSRGNCVAVGWYEDSSSNSQPIAVTEANGRFGRAVELTLPDNTATDPFVNMYGVSCARRGDCVAVGGYLTSRSDAFAPMGIVESGGKWQPAIQLALPADAEIEYSQLDTPVVSISCAAACVGVGSYPLKSGRRVATGVTESGGEFSQVSEIAGAPDLDGVACPSGQFCVAVGDGPAALLRSGGKWHRPAVIKMPPNAAPGAAAAGVATAVSCASGTYCVAVGSYTDRQGNIRVMAAAS
jgi:hypothetical protein